MKLLVVVETLKGIFMARSMAMTLTAPEPMPSRPESAPAPNIMPKPVRNIADAVSFRACRRRDSCRRAANAWPARRTRPGVRRLAHPLNDWYAAWRRTRPKMMASAWVLKRPARKAPKIGAEGGGDLKEHADADVGETLAHIGCRRAGRSGDDGDQRRADGVFDVDAERERERGHTTTPAAKAGERAEKARERGEQPDHDGEFQAVIGWCAIYEIESRQLEDGRLVEFFADALGLGKEVEVIRVRRPWSRCRSC